MIALDRSLIRSGAAFAFSCFEFLRAVNRRQIDKTAVVALQTLR